MFLHTATLTSSGDIDPKMSDAILGADILIVDDNLANVELLREILQHHGFKNITGETDSRRVVGLCRDRRYDILLLDIRMPHVSGFDLIELVKKDVYADDLVPILVLTAQTDLETRRRSLQLGANDFLNKPFVAWELLHRVRNALSTRIFYRELLAQKQDLARRVGERTAELQAALVAAQEGERAKLDFLTMMSHELRTPLNSIVGFAEVMATPGFTPLKPAEMMEYARLIEENGKSLLTMVNKLLEFTRSGPEAETLAESDFSLRRLINACIEQLLPKAESRQVAMVMGECAPVALRADRRRIRDMLTALLDNAVKFNRPGGEAAIAVECDGNGEVLRITVSDTGVGIPEQARAKLFTPFQQGDGSLRRPHEGIGLGLPMVRRYAEMHGGVVEVASAEGGGTTVTVTLPLSRVVGRESAVAVSPV